jgi:hypothetical protein
MHGISVCSFFVFVLLLSDALGLLLVFAAQTLAFFWLLVSRCSVLLHCADVRRGRICH